MLFEDFREYIEKCREIDQVKDIEGADWNLEIGAITEVMATTKPDAHPLLLFDKIKGYPKGYRVASNFMNTARRTAVVMGMPLDVPKMELIKHWKERVKSYKGIPPREVSDGPVMENTDKGDKVDLFKFPVPKWHELDGGRYLGTACMVITPDPDTGWVNLGVYRLQVHNKNTMGLYISPGHHGWIIGRKWWAQGKSCPIAVTFGQEPAVWVGATYGVPYGISEYDWTGWARGKPVDVIKGPVTGLPIPATAEIVVEGEVPPPDKEGEIEGPFGEWPGYYAHGALREPIVKVNSVMYRNDPVIAGAPPLKPTSFYSHGIPFGAAQIWDQLDACGVQDIRGVWTYYCSTSGGGGLPFIVISLKQRYPGHAKQALLVTAGARAGAYLGRYVVVVDEDIDPTDIREVMWAVASRSDPATSVDIIRDTWSTFLDPRIPPEKRAKGDLTNSRALVNACRPFDWIKDFPPVNSISPGLKKQTIDKWGNSLGLT
ncbi:MAG: UbiD family decarboxylase [Thaumarchaeota archaeon]|nr:UbiD family decarboxylase [Nitrososphaerota archaeon]